MMRSGLGCIRTFGGSSGVPPPFPSFRIGLLSIPFVPPGGWALCPNHLCRSNCSFGIFEFPRSLPPVSVPRQSSFTLNGTRTS